MLSMVPSNGGLFCDGKWDKKKVTTTINPKRDMFEKKEQYQARRQQLLEEFNRAVRLGNPRYQAGVAYLEKYDADSETFYVNFKWQAMWAK